MTTTFITNKVMLAQEGGLYSSMRLIIQHKSKEKVVLFYCYVPTTMHDRLCEETIAAFHSRVDFTEDGLFMLCKKTQNELVCKEY